MSTDETITRDGQAVAGIPAPDFPHRAYGTHVDWLGDEGGMIAKGHVPDFRFVAACNHLARTDAGLCNMWDDRSVTLEDVLALVTRCWAVPIDPARFSGFEWAVDLASTITAETPGAIPVTVVIP
jgi:hypothetical protein